MTVSQLAKELRTSPSKDVVQLARQEVSSLCICIGLVNKTLRDAGERVKGGSKGRTHCR